MSKWKSATKVVVQSAALENPKSPKPKPTSLTRRPSLDKTTSWQIKQHNVSAPLDLSEMISVQIIDYSSSKLSESEGKINHDALNCADDYNDEPLLSGTVPDWASSRWTNYDVNIDHPGQLKILEHVLRGSLGQHAGELAMESISASGQRARMQFFDGVFFLLSKIPSLPEQFSSKDPATIFRLHDELLNPTAERELDEIIEFELIVFIVEPATGSLTTIQVGKEGDVWNDLRGSLRSNDGGHHDVRNRSTGLLLWNLLNEALRECDHIDESFEAIIEPMLSYFETGDEHVAADDHRMATALKSEMQAFSQQVMPLRDVFTTMATSSFFQKDVMYMEDLRDKSFRIIHNISDHSDNCQRLQEALRLSDDRRDAKVQFFISVTLAVFSPLSFVVGFYGMNFVGECPPDHDGLSACKGGIKELFWPGGYMYVWILILLVSLIAILCFMSLGIIQLPGFIRCKGGMCSRQDAKTAAVDKIYSPRHGGGSPKNAGKEGGGGGEYPKRRGSVREKPFEH